MKAKLTLSATADKIYKLPYNSLRNISSPDDIAKGRKVLAGHVAAKDILGISTHDNLRTFLLEAEGKKRKVPTAVHRAIKETIVEAPENFSVLNGGITLVCSSYEVDEKRKILSLNNSSIINGAQTQGVLKRYWDAIEEPELNFPEIFVSYQLIITDDESLIAEISVARNFQNDVKMLSVTGKLNYLDDLNKKIKTTLHKSIRRSETDLSDDFIDTEKLLQVLTVLMPEELWVRMKRGEISNKTYAYNQKAKCLKQFVELKKSYDENKDPITKDAYQYFIDMAPCAWELYNKWKSHPEFNGTGLHCIERDGKKIIEVPDGIVFPILAALSVFIIKKNDAWTIEIHELLSDSDLINNAKTQYTNTAGHKPHIMGRSKSIYASLIGITQIFKRFTNDAVAN